MLTTEAPAMMARYNGWQNAALVAAADSLSDAARWQARGAFFGSISATFNHVLWDDRVWRARLSGDAERAAGIGARHPYTDTPRDGATFTTERRALDAEIVGWAGALTARDLARETHWIRGDMKVTTPFAFNALHMFTYQSHHRGQIHAMLTMTGAEVQPTDLQMLPVGA